MPKAVQRQKHSLFICVFPHSQGILRCQVSRQAHFLPQVLRACPLQKVISCGCKHGQKNLLRPEERHILCPYSTPTPLLSCKVPTLLLGIRPEKYFHYALWRRKGLKCSHKRCRQQRPPLLFLHFYKLFSGADGFHICQWV